MEQVGEVQGYPVYYIPEKDAIFCKNTTVGVDRIKETLDSPYDRELIEEKELSVIKDRSVVYFGCLTTTTENISQINQNINKIKRFSNGKRNR